jgi:periplasmic protein TonB
MHAVEETANARFKRRSADWFWLSLTIAACFHFVVFAFWPQMTAADMRSSGDEIVMLELPPEVVVPPAPELIARPAMPVVASTDIDDSVTIPPTTFDAHPPERLTPPATAPGDRLEDAFVWVPMTVPPALLNTAEVQRALERSYPRQLRDAGIGDTVLVHFFIDEQGTVLRRQLPRPGSYPAFGEAALDVAAVMRFSPAWNRDRKVAVWVQIPIVFVVR